MKKKYLSKADKSYDNLGKGIKIFDKDFADKEIGPGIRSFDRGFDKADISCGLKKFDEGSMSNLRNIEKNNPFLKKNRM